MEQEISRLKSTKLNILCKQEPLIINSLYKVYNKNKLRINAVNNLNFGVKSEQCFGLLVWT